MLPLAAAGLLLLAHLLWSLLRPRTPPAEPGENAADTLRRIRRLELRASRLVSSSLHGHYHSVFKGRGMNFDEFREYQPGDEIRTIDWNVTARTGTAHVKKFTEERDLTVLLLLDLSPSGAYGSQRLSKRELATEVAAILALSAIRNGDRVGLLLFTDQTELYLPPRKGRQHILRLIREMLTHTPSGHGTDLNPALQFLQKAVPRRSVIFLLSDFHAPADYSRLLAVTARRHDLIAVPITDPAEENLPDAGIATLQDPETGQPHEINTSSPATRAAYRGLIARQRQQLSFLLTRNAIDSVPLSTDTDYLPALQNFFTTREHRLKSR